MDNSSDRAIVLPDTPGRSTLAAVDCRVHELLLRQVPEVAEISDLVTLARERLSDGQLWINPDCGLKTRKWEEVRPPS